MRRCKRIRYKLVPKRLSTRYMGMAQVQGNDIVTAAVLVIGDEILSGRTKDKNIGYIAEHCTKIGIQVREVRIVPDDEDEIVAAVNALRSRYDYVFTTGGIGPTHDDITADAIAKAFGVKIDVDPRALALLLPYYEKRGMEVTPARLRIAGIPNVMQVMLDAVTPRLRTGKKMHSVAIDLQVPEGTVADIFAEHQKAYPTISMGSYPVFRDNKPSTQLVLRSTDPDLLAEAVDGLKAKLSAKGML
jgi:molybdenum cofactor synthesis domain-containing protein